MYQEVVAILSLFGLFLILNNFSKNENIKTTSIHSELVCRNEKLKGFRKIDLKKTSKSSNTFKIRSTDFDSSATHHPDCIQRGQNIAIIIPYRNRQKQLTIFKNHMIPIFISQNLSFKIYVLNQTEKHPFNRAKLFNIGYKLASKERDWDCYTFHDVDLLLENDNLSYKCDNMTNLPKHLSVSIDKFKYKLPYANIFGGVIQVSKEQLEIVNGFSNEYWGWGGEDGDMRKRLIDYGGFRLNRPDADIARYKMVKIGHESGKVNSQKDVLLIDALKNRPLDGLNSLKYELVDRKIDDGFEVITVDLKN